MRVGEVEIVVARVAIIVGESARARSVIGLEHLEPHYMPEMTRGDVIGRAAEEAAVELGPGFQRAPALDEIRIASAAVARSGWRGPRSRPASRRS